MKISQLLTSYRKKNKLSQKVMAKLLGVSQSQISQWEKGKHKPNMLREKSIREKSC